MKDKTKQALKDLRETVADHEYEDRGSDVLVDLGDLKRLLRWAQNKDHTWLKGDRVKRTGARVPFNWMTEEHEGLVLEDSLEDGIALVEWDNAPDDQRRLKMYHNEIKLAKP